MYSNLILSLCTLIIIPSVLSFSSIYNVCEIEGGKSFVIENNLKCIIPNNITDQRCSELFHKGCVIAKTKKICEEGADYVLNHSKKINCLNLKLSNIRETNISRLCCQACQLGLDKFKNSQEFFATPLDSDKLNYYVNGELERCYKSGNYLKCEELQCEQGCMIKESKKVCVCDDGYQLNDDGLSCDDIDECVDGSSKCSSDQLCVNSMGSYKCADIQIERVGRSDPEGEEISTENTTSNENINLESDHDLKINDNISTNEEPIISKLNIKPINPKHILKSNANLLNLDINLIILLIVFCILKQIYQI